MSDLVKKIKDQLPPSCIVEICEENDCRVCLKDAPTPNVIVGFDKPGSPLGPRETRCDYLFIADEGPGWVVPLELTRGTSKPPRKVIAQLGAGARIAADNIPAGGNVKFVPVFVGRANRHMRDYLKANKVRFHRKKTVAKLIGCGDQLVDALKK